MPPRLRITLFLASLALVLAAPALGQGAAVTFSGDEVAIERGRPPERFPVLLYDVTGSTLIGPVHTNLAVYSDGVVSYARGGTQRSPGPCPTGSDQPCPPILAPEIAPSVEVISVGRDAVVALSRDLLRLGIRRFRGGQGPGNVQDAPVTSVSYFPPRRYWRLRKLPDSDAIFGPRSLVNSFSYFIAPTELALIQQRIFEFIQEVERARR